MKTLAQIYTEQQMRIDNFRDALRWGLFKNKAEEVKYHQRVHKIQEQNQKELEQFLRYYPSTTKGH